MGNCRDLLSDLPLSIIHEILAWVPIRDAIRTCVLSKEWRYTWTTLPHLIVTTAGVDLDSIEEDGLMKEYTESTENFISNVLLHHKGPICSFEIHSMININIDSIEKWMLCVARKDIRELNIWLDPDVIDNQYVAKNLKSSIYSCVKLTKLFLAGCRFHPPPSSFKGFLALTTLDLIDIELSTDELEGLVGCCPLLESLDIMDCSCSEFRIRSPNLKNLVLYGKQGKLCLYAPLLAKMDVTCALSTETQTLVCNYTNLLGCFTNLVELRGDGRFIRYLNVGIDSCHHTLVLHHLRVIQLLYVDLADTKEQSVARLIFGSPNLHKLQITGAFRKIGYGSDAPHVSFEDFGCEANFRLEKLREVTLNRVCDYRFGMHLIKLLLECSPVLETVDVGLISPKASAELMGFRQSSTSARILASSK